MGIKFWGYKKRSRSRDASEPMELAEVTLVASPAQLRKIAKFMEAAAEGIEKRGLGWEHEHLADKVPGFRGSPGLIVFNQQHEKK